MKMGHRDCPQCEERVMMLNDGKKTLCLNCGVIRESQDRVEKRMEEDLHKDEAVLEDEEQQYSWINGPTWPEDFGP